MEGDIITTQEVFRLQNDGYDAKGRITGRFVSTGVNPQCCDKMESNGVEIENRWFF